jgi:hypothetical protein
MDKLKKTEGGGMFGLNDDGKTADPSQHDNQDAASEGMGQSPFAAAYSSLNDSSAGGHHHDPPTESSVPEEDLLQIKTQALQSLAPLINHLDQSPEEKFKTTMMMIQATDNSEMIRDAYAAANQIEDEKARAQALLDVINEINYFTHRNKG